MTRASTALPDETSVDSELSREVEACLPILGVLRSQLADVMRDVEQSVVKVCSSFRDIGRRAKVVIAHASGDGDAGSGDLDSDRGMAELLSAARSTIADLLKNLEAATASSADSVAKLTAAEEHVRGVTDASEKIESVASQANMLALNGQIEAARAGQHGATFGIVATETAKMAEQARLGSRGIRTLIGMLSSEMSRTSRDLQQRSKAHAEQTQHCRDAVNSTFDAMETASKRLEASIASTSQNTAALADDISSAVTSLQFQDAVSQRVQHVIHAIEEIERALRGRLRSEAATEDDSERAPHRDWADRLDHCYTMSSERRTMDDVLGTNRAAGDHSGGTVELF
jgi:methyl-accepting chemotaxis protein